jgi:hypothetical protein
MHSTFRYFTEHMGHSGVEAMTLTKRAYNLLGNGVQMTMFTCLACRGCMVGA